MRSFSKSNAGRAAGRAQPQRQTIALRNSHAGPVSRSSSGSINNADHLLQICSSSAAGHRDGMVTGLGLENLGHKSPPLHAREVASFSPDGQEWDILGVGQAMVDFAASVNDGMLASLNVPKGGRRVITVEERARVMEVLEGCESQVSAGGSLANTLVGLGQLGAAQDRAAGRITSSITTGQPPAASAATSSGSKHHSSARVAMTGCVGGTDALGEFARAQLQAGGVDVVGPGPVGQATGVVMVFSTPDAQRSFLSSFSSDDRVEFSAELQDTVSRARLLLIEGYLWELPGAAEAIPLLVQHARACGTLVALTAGDAGVVERHGAKVLGAIAAGVDVWFGNEAEAAALVGHLREQQEQQQQQQQQPAVEDDEELDFTVLQLQQLGAVADSNNSAMGASSSSSSSGQAFALQLASICPMVVVTDGSRGSYITALGQLVVVPPFWSSSPPVDTCGAGDAYAAGLLHGFLMGLDLHGMGQVAAKTASAVISRHGPQLLPEDADWVVAGLVKQQRGAGVTTAAAAAAAGSTSSAAADADMNRAGSGSSWTGDWSGSVLQ